MQAQFRPAFESWWATMSTPDLSDATCRQIIDRVNAEADGRSLAQLAAERDAILLPLLELVSQRS
jgi:carnitine 3-dehydrogenase